MSRPRRTPQYYRRRWLVRIAVWTTFGFWFLPHVLRQDGAWALFLVGTAAGIALRIRQDLTRPVPAPDVTSADRVLDTGLQTWHQPGQNRETRYRPERAAP